MDRLAPCQLLVLFLIVAIYPLGTAGEVPASLSRGIIKRLPMDGYRRFNVDAQRFVLEHLKNIWELLGEMKGQSSDQ